jgi:integrase
MNKNLHRIIFNARRGQRMAVAETATAQGKAASGERITLGLGRLMAGSLFALPLNAQVVADKNAPGNQRPTVVNTASGITQVNIQNPIRLDELANATHKDFLLETLPDLPETWVLTVTGKRNKTREVPLNPDVVRLLATHGGEFLEKDVALEVQSDLPLIRTLHCSVAKWSRAHGGELVVGPSSKQLGSPLSASGIYAVLKRFFRQAATTAEAAGLDARRFERSSTHWMRHTFIRQAMVDGVPIEVACELAGHTSLTTTSIYSSQELARKIKAVQGMRRRVI